MQMVEMEGFSWRPEKNQNINVDFDVQNNKFITLVKFSIFCKP